jgi:chromate reductase
MPNDITTGATSNDILTIGCIVGSSSSRSINAALLDAVVALAPDVIGEPDIPAFRRIEIAHLPLYNQDVDDSYPAAAVRLKDEIGSCDGLLLACPEYNRSIPAVLTNALSWASRPYGESVLGGVPVAVISASIGASGGAMAQQHLRNVLAYLDAPTLGQPEAFIHYTDQRFGDDGQIEDDSTREFLGDWLVAAVDWIRRCSGVTTRR